MFIHYSFFIIIYEENASHLLREKAQTSPRKLVIAKLSLQPNWSPTQQTWPDLSGRRKYRNSVIFQPNELQFCIMTSFIERD